MAEAAKKYRITDESMTLADGTEVHRIQALKDFGNVKAGDLGGWIEKEANLRQEGRTVRRTGSADSCSLTGLQETRAARHPAGTGSRSARTAAR